MTKYKIVQKLDECISCGACVAVCEENWKSLDDGTMTFKEEIITEEQLENNKDAAESCPVECISIEKIE